MRRRTTTLACLAVVLLSAGPAVADIGGDTAQEGIKTSLTNAGLDRATKGLDILTGAADRRTFEYTSVYACHCLLYTSDAADE